MLLAEDLLLLVTNDASGRLSVPAAQADAGLGGANLLELALMNKVGLSGEHDTRKPGRIVVRYPAPGDPVLDAAVQIILACRGSKPSTLIGPLGKNLRHTLYERLAGRGLLHASQGRIIGRNAAIVQTGHFRLTGRLAWITWGFLHLTYLPGAVNRMITGMKYLWWHLSHENTSRVLIEPEPATPPHAAGGSPDLPIPAHRAARHQVGK